MVEERRGPGRPAYDSKQKLVAAACALLAERGFEATSPQMFQQRSGVGHGSMYHHFPGKEKRGSHWTRSVICGRARPRSSTAPRRPKAPRLKKYGPASWRRWIDCSPAGKDKPW